MKIGISTGNSRKDKVWKYKEITIEDFIKRISITTRTSETVEEYRKLPKIQQDEIKDVGGFVLGRLKDNKRKKDCMIYRTALTLDMDYASSNIIDEIEMFFSFRCLFYSTHKHTTEKPRLRLIIPLSRNISPDEYSAISRMIANEIGMELFDDTTYEPSRLMYWPSTSQDGEFIFREVHGETLNPDEVLVKYENWKDPKQWPVSHRQNIIIKNNIEKQADPLQKTGLIGAFCRTYSISDVIEIFLPNIYEKSYTPGRYDYIPATSQAGVVIYDDKFAYSHHATDLACDKLVNAFDMVRIHKFSHLDDKNDEEKDLAKLPSFKAMEEFVINDEKVKICLAKERQELALEEFSKVRNMIGSSSNSDSKNNSKSEINNGDDISWQKLLELDKQGNVKNTMTNIANIIRYDVNLKSIIYNELKCCIDVIGNLPWKQVRPGWGDADMSCAKLYFERVYNIWSPVKFKDALLAVTSAERAYHPIKEYLDNLTWDKKERVDTLLADYLGAGDNEYVSAVTRKALVAAVARVYQPGIKFDSILVLSGPQGIGKSTIFSILGKNWYSDSLSISDMKDKTAAEKLQGYWILELGELAGIRKMDVETVKAFITRTDDKFRQSYGVNVESHPRSNIIVGTTNAETGFLRDVTGNRRFWPVYVSGRGKYKPWDLKDVDQIWAEVVYRYKMGEELFLKGNIVIDAKKAQNNALELDDRQGIVSDYLNKLLPTNWDKFDLYKRRSYLNNSNFDFDEVKGTVTRTKVCVMEIWCECFLKERSDLSKADSYEVEGILNKIGGWEKLNSNKTGKIRYSLYGPQKTFVRENSYGMGTVGTGGHNKS